MADGAAPHDLIAVARDLARVDDSRTVGLWPRAAAMLCRQAIEASLEDLWRLRCPGLAQTPARCQLICLPAFLGDRALAGRVGVCWDGLSRACHLHVYELAPTAEELGGWLACAWELADAVERLRPPTAAPAPVPRSRP